MLSVLRGVLSFLPLLYGLGCILQCTCLSVFGEIDVFNLRQLIDQLQIVYGGLYKVDMVDVVTWYHP